MPIGLNPILPPDLLYILASMGHGDDIAFDNQAREAFAVVQTGERRLFGNVILKKDGVAPD